MNLPGSKKKQQRLGWLGFCFLVIAMLALVACGGGKKTSVADEGEQDVSIDQLLGIEGEKAEPEEPNPEEGEVLRLLGITKDEAGQTQTEQVPAGPDLAALQDEVKRLETELSEKDRIIQDLRADLEQKDKRIEELQASGASLQPAGSRMASRPRASAAAVSGSYRERYRAALDAYNARQYRDAINAFSRLLAEDANNSLADNCQYWIGESYYGLGNYAQAIAEFEKVFAYPNSNKADDALLKLGVTYLKLGDRESARTQFEQLLANYPKSEYLDKARGYLNRL